MSIIVLIIPVLSILVFILILLSAWRFQQFDPKHHFFTSRINNFLQSVSAKLTKHIRLYIFILAGVWGLGVAGSLYFISTNLDALIKELVRIYGFTSLYLLFLTLTPGLVRAYFPHFILDSLLIKSRRALGVNTFIFGLVHGLIAFIYYYSGSWQKISTLPLAYQIAFYLASAALIIFTLLAITSFDKIVEIITFQKWKILHRFIYLAFLMIVLHAFIRGTHLSDPYKIFSAIMVFLSLTFILLEIGATSIFIINHNQNNKLKSYLIFLVLGIVGFSSFYLSFLKLDQIY